MPFYRYTATDSSGQEVQGTLQAPTAGDVTRLLQQRGFRNVSLDAPKTPAAPVAQTPPPVPKQTVVRTKTATDRQRHFLFAQLARLYGAGVPPVQAMQTLASQNRHPGLKTALTDLARGLGVGETLADGLARYPDLFPAHVVATTRAGETGGFLPEALEAISDQAGAAGKFRLFHWFVWLVVINMLLVLPLVYQVTRSLLGMWDRVNETGGSGGMTGALGEMSTAFWEMMVWPFGPMALVFWGLVAWGAKWFFSTNRAPIRHRLALGIPVLGKRAKLESIAVFNWILSKLSNAGLTPRFCWALAADSVPNMEVAQRLRRVGATMGEQSKLSEAFAKERIFPEEFGSIVATGEMVGDVPGSLQRMADTTRNEFEVQTNHARLRTGCWGLLVLFVTMGLAMAMLMYLWYHELPARILEDF